MRTIKIKLSAIQEAIEAAHAVSDDWQAECLEILRIPAIAKRWRELNPRFPAVEIRRHDGAPHKGFQPDDNRAIGERNRWSEYAGYVFTYGLEGCGWNSVKDDYYGHSPSSAWNGCGRETICRFAEALRMFALGYDHDELRRSLKNAGIALA